MKRKLLTIFMWVIFSSLNAQTFDAIFFTENGEHFYVVLNGILQNENPETNVKITGLNAPSYQVKIIFEDKSPGELNKTVYFNEPGVQYTFVIKKNGKGEYKIRYFSAVPLTQTVTAPAEQQVIVYRTSPPPVRTVVTQTTTTTVRQGTVPQGGISMGVNGNGVNINFDVNGNSVSSTTTHTETVTTTVEGYPQVQHEVVYVPGYSGPVGCPRPMSNPDFQRLKRSIQSKSFSDSRLAIAKQAVNTNCLTSQQVRDLMNLFDFEEDKLEFAKYCYGYTYDLGNYFLVNDAFDFESSIDELNRYIQSH